MKIKLSSGRLFLGLVAAGLAGALIGCSTPTRFRVDALARSDAAPLAGMYRIVGDVDAQGQSSPYFEEIASHLRAALNARGLTEAWEGAQPDVEIVVSYGVGPPRQISQESRETLYGMGTMRSVHFPTSGGGARPNSVYIPTQSVNARGLETKIYYESRLTIVGRQPESARRGAPMREVWRVEVTTTDQKADVNKLIPLMVTAAEPHLGTASGERLEVSVSSASVLPPAPGASAATR